MSFWVEVGKASVYQALRRLEEHGFASGRPQEGAEGPDRRVYRITAAGRARLRAGLRERCADARPYGSEASLALGFVHLLPLDEARRVVGERETALGEWRSRIAAERARAADRPGTAAEVARHMLELQDALARTEQRWIRALGADLGSLRP
jgi:DNA-binding PadR family transcriptional regulator